jgi:hypothetical protein
MDNSVEWFECNGQRYGKGTIVRFSDIALHKYNNYLSNNTAATFLYRDSVYNTLYFLIKDKYSISIDNNVDYIAQIVYPVYCYKKSAVDSAIKNYQEHKKAPDVFNGMLWYILIVVFLLFCNNGIMGIIVVTIMLINWLINKYKD